MAYLGGMSDGSWRQSSTRSDSGDIISKWHGYPLATIIAYRTAEIKNAAISKEGMER